MKKLLPLVFCSLTSACSVTNYSEKTSTHSQFSENGSNIAVEQLAKTSTSWDDTQLPNYPYAQPEITILKVTIPVGLAIDTHKHQVINAAYILRGHLKVISEKGDEIEFKAGDGLVEMINTWHYGVNIGQEPVEIIVFYAGAKNMPLNIKKSDKD